MTNRGKDDRCQRTLCQRIPPALLLAAGVVVSYVTLRPRAAVPTAPTGLTTGPARESVAVAELSIVDELAGELDELAGELMVADEVAP